MKNMLLLIVFLTIVSCRKDPSNKNNASSTEEVNITAPEEVINNFKKIQGIWALQPSGSNLEMWETVDDGMIGRGLAISENKDTSFTEIYFLETVNDSLRLQVQPISDGGISMPIDYFLVESNDNRFVFQNLNHNFPKRMTYVVKEKTFNIYLEGEIEGMMQQADFTYKKIEQ